MAEEAQYGADLATNKRKYEDNTPSPASAGRRPTGFSAPIASQSPPNAAAAPGSYNSVPPPMDEIQLAKQKAQEIAARILNNAPDPTKRPRTENGDFNDYQKPISAVVTPPMTGSYGYPGPNKRIEIPNGRVGVIIGKAGETIKYLQLQSGAKIQVTRDTDADPHAPTRGVELTGTPEQIAKAEQLIKDVLSEAESGGSGISSRRVTGQQYGTEQYVTKIPNNKVGLVIGKGGETIKSMQASSGARIQVIPLHLPPGDPSTERTLQIDGTSEQIEAAKQLVNEVISENRVRNSSMGGYSQQGYQTRPPTNWAQQGASTQQPGYGYMPPGAYPGQPPQYNTTQPPYSGYPPQPQSGYAAGWDQSSAASNQQTAQGYDYYSQQPPATHQQAPGGPGAPTDGAAAAYGYNQQPASGYNQGQGYGQDGYGGYQAPAPQSGYGQPQAYDQQGYNSAAGYGNASNPTPEGQTAAAYGTQADATQTAYSTGQQPSPNPSYPTPGSAQSGYAAPPGSQGGYATQPSAAGYGASYGGPPPPQGQKPPTSQPPYGQPQQSPSTQGYSQPPPAQSGYAQPPPAQSGYAQPPPAQSGYPQSDSGAQRPPSSGYGAPTAQAGYGYGAAAPGSQPGYGQQPPAAYNASYGGGGGGYSQPAAAYDSAAQPASQATPPAKASPQS